MIEVADANATYYYHFDALGSVVALSDAAGDTVQTYEYSVYGEVAVEDANHPNPYMFAGRRYDIEIGLYYNRARYYNPFTGRFLQADPIVYGAGMNMYRYCSNNPLNLIDPSGLRDCNTTSSHYLEGDAATQDSNSQYWDEILGENALKADPCSCEGRLAARILEAILEKGECADLARSINTQTVSCIILTGVAAGVGASGGPIVAAAAAGGTFVGCVAVSAVLDAAQWSACEAEAKCELASAYESYDYCRCKREGGETATCAREYLHDQEDPWWATWMP